MSKAILVTGHRGFIGSHVFAALKADGNDVVGYDWPDNVAELGNVEGFDAIVNLAAIGGEARAARSPCEVMRNNVGASIALRGAIKRNEDPEEPYGWPHVVHVSSFSVYGSAMRDCPVRGVSETCAKEPMEIYGASKLAQELCWRGYHGPVTILRLSSVYGSGMRLHDPEATVIAKVAAAAKTATPFTVFGEGSDIRDFVHVSDVVDAVRESIAQRGPAPCGAVNVCSGQPTTIVELCNLFGVERLHMAPRPGDMPKCLGNPATLKQLIGRDPRRLQEHFMEVLKCAAS